MLDAVALHSAPIMEFTTSAFAPKAEVYPCRRYFRKVPIPEVPSFKQLT